MAELIIVSEGQHHIMMRDLLKSNYDNVTVTDFFRKIRPANPFGWIMRKLHCSNKIYGVVKLPLKQLWRTLKWFTWDKDNIPLAVAMINKQKAEIYLPNCIYDTYLQRKPRRGRKDRRISINPI